MQVAKDTDKDKGTGFVQKIINWLLIICHTFFQVCACSRTSITARSRFGTTAATLFAPVRMETLVSTGASPGEIHSF